MGDKPGKGRRDVSGEIAEARRLYEQEGITNLSELLRRVGIKRDTIARHLKEQNWATKGQINNAARSNVIDIATRQALKKMGGDAGVDKMAGAIAEELRLQSELWADAGTLIKQTLTRALNLSKTDDKGKPLPNRLILGVTQGETTAVNDILSSLMRFTQGGRLSHGIEEGQPTVPEAPHAEPGKEYIIAIRPEDKTA